MTSSRGGCLDDWIWSPTLPYCSPAQIDRRGVEQRPTAEDLVQEAAAMPLPTWESFYVIVGSSAAALTGLMFVVIPLVAETRQRSSQGVSAFGTPTIVHFCLALFVSAVLSGPCRAPGGGGLTIALTRVRGPRVLRAARGAGIRLGRRLRAAALARNTSAAERHARRSSRPRRSGNAGGRRAARPIPDRDTMDVADAAHSRLLRHPLRRATRGARVALLERRRAHESHARRARSAA